MEPLEAKPSRHHNTSTIFYVIGCAWGAVAYGYAAGIIATTIAQPTFLSYMGLDTAPNASGLLGATNALFFVGGIFGTTTVGFLAGRYGRKVAIATGVSLIMVSSALMAGSVHISMFIVFRFFCGVGSYITIASVPLWVTEVVPPNNRGVLSDVTPISVTFGYMVAAWIGLGFYWVDSPDTWRGPIAFNIVPCFFCLIALWFIPESPRYLLIRNRNDEAWAIVRRLHSFRGDESFAQREFEQMRRQIQFERSLKPERFEILRRPSYRKRVILTVYLMFTMVSSGILVIGNYGPVIYGHLGYDSAQQLVLFGGYQVAGTGFNILAILVVDRMPRNVLIAVGLTGCTVSLILEAAFVATFLDSTYRSGQIACVAMFYLYVLSYGGFLDGATWWYSSEIFPTHLRANGVAIGTATYCLTNIVWLQAAPTAFDNIGWRYYLFFIIISAIGAVVIFFTFPDTLKKPLEEVARLFGDEDLVMASQGLSIEHAEAGDVDIKQEVAQVQEEIST